MKAVFIDKDGTLIENVPYNVDPAKIVLCPGAEEAVRALARHGFALVVVSNQPGIGFGKFSKTDLELAFDELSKLARPLHSFYFCPHRPGDGCGCRKPACGMIERAAREHGIELGQSWMVGDILDDIEAGRRAGCRTVLVDNGNETEWRRGPLREPHHVVSGLLEASRVIAMRSGSDPEFAR